jgi:hypothetical protein
VANVNDRGIEDSTRHLAIAALTAVAVTHFSDLPDKIAEAPYLALLFAANIGLSLGLAALLMMRRAERTALSAAGILGLGTLAAYVASRSVGLPRIEDHVGHWLDPGGVAAALAEITLIGLAIPMLGRTPRRLATFVAVPMAAFVGVAVAAGQAFEGHVSGHEHGARSASHGHTAALGPTYPDVEAASGADREKAGRLLEAVSASAMSRFPSYAAARRLRYKSSLSLPSLFRAPTHGGRLVPWHGHTSRTSGRPGSTVMTHVWLTGDTRTALAHCFPVEALERAIPRFRYSAPGSGRAGGSPPCPPES